MSACARFAVTKRPAHRAWPCWRWLRGLGIETRADNLAAYAPEHAEAIHAAKERLIGEGQMGALFKVMGIAAPNWPEGAGF